MERTAYFGEGGKPRLVRSYCIFLDFLGFSQQIKAALQRGEEEALFQDFMQNVEPAIERIFRPTESDEVPGFPRHWDTKLFTDNIILGYTLQSGHGESEFGSALFQVMEFQLLAALKGFFVRGGWAVGNLFINENTVFGSALIEAHDLENKKAISPRIILSDAMKDVVFRHMAFHAEPPQSQHLLIDNDGVVMTNYLTETFDEDGVEWGLLASHSQLISKRLEEQAAIPDNGRVVEKYRWLAAYHNWFCDMISRSDGYSERIKVPGEVPDYGLRPLRREDSPYPPSPRRA